MCASFAYRSAGRSRIHEALVAPRALAEERLPADHRERDPPVVAARARGRAEEPVGRALLQRRGGAHLADLAHADDHDPDCGERCDGHDGAPRGARQPDRGGPQEDRCRRESEEAKPDEARCLAAREVGVAERPEAREDERHGAGDPGEQDAADARRPRGGEQDDEAERGDDE